MFKWETDFSKLDYLDDDNFSGYHIEDADYDHFYKDDILCWCYLQNLIDVVPPDIKDKIESLAK